MYFCVNKFEVGINDSIFSGNEQQKVYVTTTTTTTTIIIIIMLGACSRLRPLPLSLVGWCASCNNINNNNNNNNNQRQQLIGMRNHWRCTITVMAANLTRSEYFSYVKSVFS